MSDDKKTTKIDNARILTVADGGKFTGSKGDVQMWALTVQNIDVPTEVFSGTAYREKLPDGVEAGSEVKDVDVVVETKGDKKYTKIYFSDQGNKSFGNKSWGGAKEDVHLKIVSFAYSYQKDLAIATGVGELSYDEFFKGAEKMAVEMMKTYNMIKTL